MTKSYYTAFRLIEAAKTIQEFRSLIKKIRTSIHLTEDERGELERKCLLAHGEIWFQAL